MPTDPPPANEEMTEVEIAVNRRLIHLWIEHNFDCWQRRAMHMADDLDLPWEEAHDCLVKTIINTADVIEREALKSAVKFGDGTVIWEFVKQLMADGKLAIIRYLRWKMLDLRRKLKLRNSLYTTFTDMPVSDDDADFDPGNDDSTKMAEMQSEISLDAEELEREIFLLRKNQQTVIRQRQEGRSFHEIGEAIGKSPVATEGDYHRGRRLLGPASQRLLDALVKHATDNPNL